MMFAPTYSRHERAVVSRLLLMGLDGDRAVTPRREFSAALRTQLVAEAEHETSCADGCELPMASCW